MARSIFSPADMSLDKLITIMMWSLSSKPSQAWLKSAFLLLPPNDLQALGSLVSVTDEAALFSGEAAAPFREDAPLSRNLQNYLLESLTRNRALTADTLSIFQSRVMQLVNEHLLTSRMRTLGCTILDGSWQRAESLLPVNDAGDVDG